MEPKINVPCDWCGGTGVGEGTDFATGKPYRCHACRDSRDLVVWRTRAEAAERERDELRRENDRLHRVLTDPLYGLELERERDELARLAREYREAERALGVAFEEVERMLFRGYNADVQAAQRVRLDAHRRHAAARDALDAALAALEAKGVG